MQPEIDVQLVRDENGKLHVFINEDVIFHYLKSKQEIVHDISVDYSKTKIVATAHNHHTNPPYSKELEEAVNNKVITDAIKQKTDKFYKQTGRLDYKTIGKQMMYNNRLRFGEKCSCK